MSCTIIAVLTARSVLLVQIPNFLMQMMQMVFMMVGRVDFCTQNDGWAVFYRRCPSTRHFI